MAKKYTNLFMARKTIHGAKVSRYAQDKHLWGFCKRTDVKKSGKDECSKKKAIDIDVCATKTALRTSLAVSGLGGIFCSILPQTVSGR